jgi:CrcB protein
MFFSLLLAARYGETFPVGTLIINIVGSFVIGLYVGLTGPQGVLMVSPLARQFVTVGILGGFTTFSSFTLQTYNLLADGEWLRGGLNIVLSLCIGLFAVWLGSLAATLLNHR